VGLVRAIEFGQPLSGLTPDLKTSAEPVVQVATANAPAETTSNVTVRTTTNPAARTSVITSTNLLEDVLRNVDVTSLKLGENITKMF
jgi:hypothetical protein